MAKPDFRKDKPLTPVRAMRAKCLDCAGGMRSEVEACLIHSCYLYPYRMGKNPARKGISGGLRPSVEKS